MIRTMLQGDLSAVMDLWLQSNLDAHSFIPPDYWRQAQKAVAAALPRAEVFVYCRGKAILGFAGLSGSHIEGIFVARACRSQGIGRALMAHIKERNSALTLSVYAENQRAVRFYEREGFSVQAKQTDQATGCQELQMVWSSQPAP